MRHEDAWPETMYLIPYIGVWFSAHLCPVLKGFYNTRGANDNVKISS